MLYALCAALSLALLGLDQWVKHYVTVNIPLGEAQPFLPGLVELRTVHNYGRPGPASPVCAGCWWRSPPSL